MWLERFIEKELNYATQKFSVVVLTGARQVGKTELLRHLYPNMSYADLTPFQIAKSLEGNPDVFFRERKMPVILDEIQYVPSAFRTIKSIVDRQPGVFQFI